MNDLKSMESKEKLSLFKCVYCEKSFSSASNRSRHMETTHKKNSCGEEVPIRRFTCVFCDKAYTRKASLQQHLDSVHLYRNKVFKCDRSNCFFKSDRKSTLNRHILNVHRPRPNYTEKQKVKCGKCPSTFIQTGHLRRHEKKIHKDIHPGNVKRKCPLCPFYSMKKNKEEIIGHFEKSHNLKISTEKHSFVDLDEFNEWRYQLQTNTLATFVKGKASSNQARSLLFICHRRGYFKTQGHNIRHIKMSGSCKINAYCPCEIHAKINKNGSVSVVYYPTHVGHKNDSKFMRLPAADKIIKSKLQILRRRHKNAFLIPENSVIKDNTKWTVLSASNNEFYCVKKVQDCKQCQLQCLHCGSCLHEYICTCLDNSIKNNMCKHIHAVCRAMKNDCVTTTEDAKELIMDVEEDIYKINTQHTVLMEISNSSQSNKMCKEDLEILCKQLLEATSTNEEISLVKKSLRETIYTVKAMKTTATPPLVRRGRTAKNENAEEPAAKKPAKTAPAKTDFSTLPDYKICERKTADGKEWNFKISSWNVAGLRSCAGKGFTDYVKHEDPDIFCMQETKCPDEKLPPEVKIAGYSKHFLAGSKPGYAGVALYSKVKPIEVKFGLGSKEFDDEGRVITAEFEKFFLVNTYVVNAGQGLKTLSKRMKWDELFRNHLKELDAKKPVILTGDLNVAHNPIDLANPTTNTKSAGFTIEERDGFTELLKSGFVDTFRDLYPDKKGCYSYWTYLGNARSRNTGWRLDYFVLSERFKTAVCDNVMRTDIYGSDHCPITLFLHLD